MQDPEHLKHAKHAARRRKTFRLGLVGVVLLGGVFGYLTSDWFLNQAPSYVEGLETSRAVGGVIVNGKAGSEIPMSETILVVFGLFGVFIWPAVLAVIYLLFGWWLADKHAAADWDRETDLQEVRAAETARRIADAKARGDLDRWSKAND